MKNVLFVMFFLATAVAVNAQVSGSVKKVDASEVPQAVLDAQARFFSGITVTAWEVQTASARDKSGSRYIASFKKDGQATRARYKKNGVGISATSYYKGTQLPQAIQDAAASNYAGYTLNSGEKIQLLNSGKLVFRIRLRKGAQKLVAYVDESGKEVSKNNVPDEVVSEE